MKDIQSPTRAQSRRGAQLLENVSLSLGKGASEVSAVRENKSQLGGIKRAIAVSSGQFVGERSEHEDTQMVNNMKRYSTSFIITELQIKTIRYH